MLGGGLSDPARCLRSTDIGYYTLEISNIYYPNLQVISEQ